MIAEMRPESIFELMECYDRLSACEKLRKKVEADIEAGKSSDDLPYLPAIKSGEEAEYWEFMAVYDRALQTRDPNRIQTEQAFRDAYERYQYEKRSSNGEPVVFRNGRCYFEGFVLGQGYLPGLYPGLERYNTQGLSYAEFIRWLEITKPARQKSKLPLVGFFENPVCGASLFDMFKFNAVRYKVFGAESWKQYLSSSQENTES